MSGGLHDGGGFGRDITQHFDGTADTTKIKGWTRFGNGRNSEPIHGNHTLKNVSIFALALIVAGCAHFR